MAAGDGISGQFLFSAEEECLTATPEDPKQVGAAIETFLSMGRQFAPSLPGVSGYFNGYGRVYADSGHIELAAAECDDPYLLPILIEKQYRLAARAVAQMAGSGLRLVLANNNHSGLLCDGCAVWGAHENYLVEKHPSEFTDLILPFLVTRIYAGAGGIRFPSGEFVAGVRPLCVETTTGGGTTRNRAIHSTAREEHHVGATKKLFRYHQIIGDGHRSHWNRAIQFGATALALKSAIFDPLLSAELQAIGKFPRANGNWVGLLKRLNRLAAPGTPLAIHPLIVQTQRVYLESAHRINGALRDMPPWISHLLKDWADLLNAMERLDRPWLAARLDAFTKFELYTSVLEAAEASWQSLPGRKDLFHSLALLDQNYHEFCNPNSVFCRLDETNVLAHRVGEIADPGSEPHPYIPETKTRARARARFLCDQANETGLVMDWSCVHDLAHRQWRQLFHPFADSYGPWRACNLSLHRLLAQAGCFSDEPNLDSLDG